MSSFLSECLLSVLASNKFEVSASPPYHDIKANILPDATPLKCDLAWPRPLEGGALEAVGNTPIIRLPRLEAKLQLKCKVYVKAEFMSIGGSVKDRIGKAMVTAGEEQGLIRPGDYVIEATSGNTGVGLALMCACKGYKMVTVMPDKMSMEKSSVMKALGAEVIRTRTSAAWHEADSHISISYKLRDEINRRADTNGCGPRAIVFDQYQNCYNPTIHYTSTGEEIVQQMASSPPSYVIISAGTGGTLTGVSRRVKEAWPTCKVIGVDPIGSILHKTEWKPEDIGAYETEGIGYDFHPSVLSKQYVDSWELIGDEEGLTTARRVIATEGIMCGGSSGLAMAAALRIASKADAGQSILVLMPDSIRNYLSKFASDDWMLLHGWDCGIDESGSIPEATPVADGTFVKVLDKAPYLSSLPRVNLEKATVGTTIRQCVEHDATHCLVQRKVSEDKYEMRLISVTYLRQQILRNHIKKRMNEVDYRMSIQIFGSYGLNSAKAQKYLCAMVDQNIQDPLLLVAEAQDVSESFPQQHPPLIPLVDETHSSFIIESLERLDHLKYITVDALAMHTL